MSNREIIEWLKKKAEAVPMPGARKMYEAAAKALEAAQPELGTNLAEVGTDCISRRAAIDALEDAEDAFGYLTKDWREVLEQLPPIQPETATITIGRTKGDVTMWYECGACGEPIDICDCYCRKCGRKLKHE